MMLKVPPRYLFTRRIIAGERQTAARPLHQRDLTAPVFRLIRIPLLCVQRDISPLDTLSCAEAIRIGHGQHGRSIGDGCIEIEIIRFKIARRLDRNPCAVDIQYVSAHICIIAATIDAAPREIGSRLHAGLRIAQIDRIARRLTSPIRLAAIDAAGHCAARNRDDIICDSAG